MEELNHLINKKIVYPDACPAIQRIKLTHICKFEYYKENCYHYNIEEYHILYPDFKISKIDSIISWLIFE